MTSSQTDALYVPGQCLVCGGRGGWWIDDFGRDVCSRCDGDGWDPSRGQSWFPDGGPA
jgi:hypothetical protein